MIKSFVLVGLGGMLGSMLRYGVALLLKHQSFPFATLVVNVVGCFFIGLLSGWLMFKHDHHNLRLLLVVGFCGGFTTFSAFSAECINLIVQQRWLPAAAYILMSVISCLAATFAGISLAK